METPKQTVDPMVRAALRARAKHPELTNATIAHYIAQTYGIALDRMPAVRAEITAALDEAEGV